MFVLFISFKERPEKKFLSATTLRAKVREHQLIEWAFALHRAMCYRNSEQTPDRTYICCCKFMYINASDMIIAAATALGLMSHFFHHFCQRMLMCFFTLLLVCVCVCVCVCGRAGAIKVRPSTIGRHKPPRTSLTGSSSHSSSSSSSSSLRPWMSLSRDEQINGLSQYSTLSPSLLPRLPVCVSILRSLSLAFNSFTNC